MIVAVLAAPQAGTVGHLPDFDTVEQFEKFVWNATNVFVRVEAPEGMPWVHGRASVNVAHIAYVMQR